MHADKREAILWARHILSRKEEFFLLDTETTGLHNAEAVEICCMSLDGDQLIDTRIKPTIPIPKEVTRIHGIRDEDVKNSPGFPEVYPELKKLFERRTAIIYNSSFDCAILEYCARLHELPPLNSYNKSVCLMLMYARFVGQWDANHGDYKWHKLGGGHSARSDCAAALARLIRMAETRDDPAYCEGCSGV